MTRMGFAVYFTALVCIFGMVSALPGGFSDVAEDNDTVKELAEFAVNELGSAFELTEIIAAKKQIVAGELYELQLGVARTTLDGTRLDHQCKMRVLKQSWLKVKSLLSFACQVLRSR